MLQGWLGWVVVKLDWSYPPTFQNPPTGHEPKENIFLDAKIFFFHALKNNRIFKKIQNI